MSIGIKVRNNIAPSRVAKQCEQNWHDGGGLGLNPKYCKKFEGTGIRTTSKQYQRNYDKIDWSKR